MSERDYMDGWADGKADRDPDPERLAYGSSVCNDYERGYIDAGHLAEPDPERPARNRRLTS